MRIAIASGKGGVGKTTFAAVLALTAARRGLDAAYLDCDVEAPNGRLLLEPVIEHLEPVTRPIPTVDLDRCRRCGACERACQFGAILCLPTCVQVNAGLCKSCGACTRACPEQAIEEFACPIGYIETGRAGDVHFAHGVLNVGQARSVPVIEAVKRAVAAAGTDLTVIDAPPGASCPTTTAVRDADLVILVAEATPFGEADLAIAAEATQALGLPVAVILNRSDRGDDRVRLWCEQRGVPVLAEVAYSDELARGYADGCLPRIVQALGPWPGLLLDRVEQLKTAQVGRAS